MSLNEINCIAKNGPLRERLRTMTKILDMIPDIVDKFTAPKEEMLKDEDAVDIAFPEDEKDTQ